MREREREREREKKIAFLWSGGILGPANLIPETRKREKKRPKKERTGLTDSNQ